MINTLALAIAAPAAAKSCGGAPSNWSRISAYPANTAARPLNAVLVGADGTLRWNGSVATRDNVQEYLRIIPMMKSNNLTVLAAGRGANCAQVKAIRAMFDQALKCTPQSCAELTQAR